MSSPTNVAAILECQGKMVIKEVPMPEQPLRPTDVLVRMMAVGICGSDVHYLTHGRIGDFVVHDPMVMGHESSGQIVAVGADVKHLAPGDRVALEPGIGCGKCEQCKTGAYNLCPDMRFFATPPVDGSMARYITHPADLCFKVPENVSYEEAAMCEPLSVGVYTCRRTAMQPGAHVLILGAGPIGIINMWVARAFGATTIFMTDVSEERLAAAKRLGATQVFNARTEEAELVAQIKAAHENGRMFDVAIECCGFESATRTALQCTKNGGVVCLVGLNQPEQRLPIFQTAVREVDIKGIFRYCNTYPTCVELLASGRVDVKPLITHRFTINELERAFEVARTGEGGALKVMFHLEDW